nr:glycoprotein [Colocasia bobone disease-associated virus]
MSGCCLFLCFFIIWLLSTSIFVKITFGFSTLSCNDYPGVPSVVSCLQTCHNFTYNKPIAISILPQTIKQSLILVKCEKVTISKAFTETWTLSRIEGERTEKTEATTIQACLKEWETKCDKKECRTKDPQISEHYSWATTEISSLEFIRVYAERVAVIEIISEDPKINIEGRSVSIHDQGYQTPGHTYAWEVTPIDTKCPWDAPSHTTVCYDIGGRMACPSQGISISKAVELKTNCKFTVFRDRTGIVFSPVGALNHEYYPVPALTIDTGLKQTIEGVRLALSIRDMQDCRYRCISMSSGYLKIDDYYYIRNNKRWLECSLLPNCTVGSESLSCNDGELVQAFCLGKPTWVNMTSAIGMRTPNCTKPNSKPIGREDIIALLNKYHASHSLFNLLSSDDIADITMTYLDKLKDLKLYTLNISQSTHSIDRHIEFLSPLQWVRNTLSRLSHKIKKLFVSIIFGVFSLIMLYATVVAFLSCIKKRRRPSISYSIVPRGVPPVVMKSF